MERLAREQKRTTFREYVATTRIGRIGRPGDFARAIAFLIDDEFVPGHAFVCDGGLALTA